MQPDPAVDLRTGPLTSRIQEDQNDLARAPAASAYGHEDSLSRIIGESNPNSEENWDFLLAKWNNNDQLLSAVEEDSVNHEDTGDTEITEDSSDENSMEGMDVEEQEPVHIEKGRGRLTSDQVVNIINEFISQYTDKWSPGKHADSVFDQAYDANELWNELRSQNIEERQRVIDNTKMEIVNYGNKLDKLCEAIFQDQWTSEKAVKQQCASLESTIDLLEQEKWELSVYQLQSPPLKPIEDNLRGAVTLNPTLPLTQAHYQSERDDEYIVHTDGRYESYQNAPAVNIEINPARQTTEIIDLGSGSESEDEVDSCQTPLDEVPKAPYTYRKESSAPLISTGGGSQQSEGAIIDSVELASSEKKRPKPRRYPSMQITPPPQRSSIRSQDPPENASYATVLKWEWNELRKKRDRKRIIMKILQQMRSSDLELIRTRIQTTRKQVLISDVSLCIAILVRNENKIPDALAHDMPKIAKFTNLFLSWWTADDYFNDADKAIEYWKLQDLAECLEKGVKDVDIFVDWTRYVLNNTFSEEALANLWAPSQAEIIVISDDEDPVL
jgi:hypothetical protein